MSPRLVLVNPYDPGTNDPFGVPERARTRSSTVRRALALGAMTAGLGVAGAGVASASDVDTSGSDVLFGDVGGDLDLGGGDSGDLALGGSGDLALGGSGDLALGGSDLDLDLGDDLALGGSGDLALDGSWPSSRVDVAPELPDAPLLSGTDLTGTGVLDAGGSAAGSPAAEWSGASLLSDLAVPQITTAPVPSASAPVEPTPDPTSLSDSDPTSRGATLSTPAEGPPVDAFPGVDGLLAKAPTWPEGLLASLPDVPDEPAVQPEPLDEQSRPDLLNEPTDPTPGNSGGPTVTTPMPAFDTGGTLEPDLAVSEGAEPIVVGAPSGAAAVAPRSGQESPQQFAGTVLAPVDGDGSTAIDTPFRLPAFTLAQVDTSPGPATPQSHITQEEGEEDQPEGTVTLTVESDGEVFYVDDGGTDTDRQHDGEPEPSFGTDQVFQNASTAFGEFTGGVVDSFTVPQATQDTLGALVSGDWTRATENAQQALEDQQAAGRAAVDTQQERNALLLEGWGAQIQAVLPWTDPEQRVRAWADLDDVAHRLGDLRAAEQATQGSVFRQLGQTVGSQVLETLPELVLRSPGAPPAVRSTAPPPSRGVAGAGQTEVPAGTGAPDAAGSTDPGSGTVVSKPSIAPGVLYPADAYPGGDQKVTDTSGTPVGLTYLPPRDSTIRKMQASGRKGGDGNVARIQSQIGGNVVDAVSAEFPELLAPGNEPLYVVGHGNQLFFFTRGGSVTKAGELADTIRSASTPDGRPVWTEGQPVVLHSCHAGCAPLFDPQAPTRAEVLSQYLGGTTVYAPDGVVRLDAKGGFVGVKKDDQLLPETGFRRFVAPNTRSTD